MISRKIVYSHDAITPEEVIKFLSLTRQSNPLFREIIKNKEVIKKAKELNLKVSDEQLQTSATILERSAASIQWKKPLTSLRTMG